MNIWLIQYGLGDIGAGVVRCVAERKNLDVVGAVDIAPDKIGKDVGDILNLPRFPSVGRDY